jgi:hypothetical protein
MVPLANFREPSASICDGLPPTTLIEPFQPDWADRDGTTATDLQLAWRTKLDHVQCSAICKIVSQSMNHPEDKTMEALIDIFDSEARNIQSQLLDGIGKFVDLGSEAQVSELTLFIDLLTLHCVRLHICVSRFMLKQITASLSGLVDTFGIATRLIEKFSELDVSVNLALYSTFYHSRTLGLAALVILKLCRSSLELFIDRDRGMRCYFAAIQLLRKRSVRDADLDTRLATILTEIWSSTLIFRNSHGVTDSISVRVRSRLVSCFQCLAELRSLIPSRRP